MTMRLILALLLGMAASARAEKFKGLAQTPPMGWNSWNKFACKITEALLRDAADSLVSSGMREAGYQYLVIDDCWHGERDKQGFIQADPLKFPSGIKALADYVHAKGLKFGIYSDAGWKTCGGRPGSRGREFQDAQTYAAWGVDYLKYDWCNTDGLAQKGAYLTMREALWEAGRPVVFSLCEWGGSKPWEWAQEVGHLWRTTGDISPCFDCQNKHGDWSSWGVMRIADWNEPLRAGAGPGHWNDPDMLEVGNGLSDDEGRSHFALWCIMAAPLMAGNDLARMGKSTREILLNKAAIAVDQDPLGIQGWRIGTFGGVEAWARPLEGGAWAFAFVNRGEKAAKLAWDWAAQPLEDKISGRKFEASADYSIQDIWAEKSAGKTGKPFEALLKPHACRFLRLSL
jgi:alpha-galactosidase